MVSIDYISSVGLPLPGSFVGADLDGVFGTDEELLYLIVTEVSEMPSDKKSVVEAAASDVVSGGKEGNYRHYLGA